MEQEGLYSQDLIMNLMGAGQNVGLKDMLEKEFKRKQIGEGMADMYLKSLLKKHKKMKGKSKTYSFMTNIAKEMHKKDPSGMPTTEEYVQMGMTYKDFQKAKKKAGSEREQYRKEMDRKSVDWKNRRWGIMDAFREEQLRRAQNKTLRERIEAVPQYLFNQQYISPAY